MSLSQLDRNDYNTVKEEALGTCPELYKRAGHSFFTTPKEKGETIQTYIRRVHQLCTRFTDAATVVECQRKMTTERILQFLPAGAAGYVRDRKPTNLRDLGTQIDDYFGNRGMSIDDYTGEHRLFPQRRQQQRQQKTPDEHQSPKRFWRPQGKSGQGGTEPRADPSVKKEKPEEKNHDTDHSNPTNTNTNTTPSSNKEWKCHKCGQRGHFARNCPVKVNFVTNVGINSPLSNTCIVTGTVAGQELKNILVDSGAEVSVVSEEIVPEGTPTVGHTRVAGVTGSPVSCRMVRLPISVKGRDFSLKAAVLKKGLLAYPLLLGKNTPGLQIHWSIGPEETATERVGVLTRAGRKKQEQQRREDDQETRDSGAQTTPLIDQTGDQTTPQPIPATPTPTHTPSTTPVPTPTTDQDRVEGGNGDGSCEGTDKEGTSDGEEDSDKEMMLDPSLCLVEPQSPEPQNQLVEDLRLARPDLAQKQREDETLESWWHQAKQDSSAFTIENEILQKRAKDPWGLAALLIVVPKSLRKQVWKVAHESPLSGHLGINKTKEKISQHFCWPKDYKDIQTWCKACPTCQAGNHTRDKQAPLQPLPVVTQPFRRVAIDIVGPLTRTARGNRFILTAMDFHSRYPEAKAIRKTDAPTVCNELLEIFSRHGLPEEILSDNGSNFVSKVTEGLLEKLQIEHLRTSPYRPQTNGMLERFHSSLKRMLGKFPEVDKEWDIQLPFCLFAFRDTPHKATGYSPFELLYGRQVRGPTLALRESWLGEEKLPKTVAEYLFDIEKKLKIGQEVMADRDQDAKDRSKAHHDQTASDDPLLVGEEVFAKLPSNSLGVTPKWEGPFSVLERRGPVSYLISAPLRGKPGRVLHRNTLKRVVRDVNLSSCVYAEEDSDEDDLLQWLPLPPKPSPSSTRWQTAPISQDLSMEQRDGLLQLLKTFFSDIPGRTSAATFSIPTTTTTPVHVHPYRIPVMWRSQLREEIDTLLSLGIIEPSTSPWSSPTVCVKKKSGGLRMCTDFRRLNDVTESDPYPIPRTDELLDQAAASTFLTTLDLSRGYYQIPVAKEDQPKTAFSVPQGKFQYRTMPFGLKGAPSCFQRLMDSLLAGIEGVHCYIDDIIITGESWEHHLDLLNQVLTVLSANNLTVKLAKCSFGERYVEFLGHCIGRGQISPQLAKTTAIREFVQPKTKRDLRAFLGLTGYYRRFIPSYASITACLTALLKKDQPDKLCWTSEHTRAFDQIKSILASEPVLFAPDYRKRYTLHTDASFLGLGAVLSQKDENDTERPVAYYSRQLKDRESRYTASEIECLAAVNSIRHFDVYLLGAEFDLITDHQALTSLRTMKNGNGRLTRWALALQQYQFTVTHRKGSCHSNADGLSRQAWRQDPSTPG